VLGVIVILLVLFVLGPIGLFFVGGAWSALHGWLECEAADARAAHGEVPPA
jgi:hypothetical protein